MSNSTDDAWEAYEFFGLVLRPRRLGLWVAELRTPRAEISAPGLTPGDAICSALYLGMQEYGLHPEEYESFNDALDSLGRAVTGEHLPELCSDCAAEA